MRPALLDKRAVAPGAAAVTPNGMADEMIRTLRLLTCIAMVISGCNKTNPSVNQGSSDVDATRFVQQAIEGLRAQTAAHASTWHLGEEDNWSADQETGRIVFTFSDGTMAEAEMQIVGTYNTDDGSFLWGWDHPSVEEPLRAHAKLAKAFGERHGLAQYTERKVICTEDEAWEFTAVAARLANANGAYRGPAGTALVYMTFGKVTLRKPVSGTP